MYIPTEDYPEPRPPFDKLKFTSASNTLRDVKRRNTCIDNFMRQTRVYEEYKRLVQRQRVLISWVKHQLTLIDATSPPPSSNIDNHQVRTPHTDKKDRGKKRKCESLDVQPDGVNFKRQRLGEPLRRSTRIAERQQAKLRQKS